MSTSDQARVERENRAIREEMARDRAERELKEHGHDFLPYAREVRRVDLNENSVRCEFEGDDVVCSVGVEGATDTDRIAGRRPRTGGAWQRVAPSSR